MKAVFTTLSLFVSVMVFSQTTTPKLYLTVTSHNEMTSTEPYDDAASTYTFYHQTKDTLKKIVDLIYNKNAKYNLQTCQKFVFGCLHAELAATTPTDILQYAYEKGGPPYGRVVEIDPRSKTQTFTTYTYNIADVAHLIDSTGAKASKTVGGFVYYNSTVTATASYSVGDWAPYTTTITGIYQPWKADIIWGAGSVPPHTHDASNYGTWKPRGKTDSLDFFCHDPNQNVWIQGNGCSWVLTPTTNINMMISEIRTEATKIRNGTYPANKFYNASIMINFKDFTNTSYPTFQIRKELERVLDSVNVMVSQNKIVWATIKQKQDTFNIWSAANSIAYSQWRCGQTATIAPTCALSSVTEFDKDDGFLKVYPNPASNELTYEFQSLTGKETYFYVYDNLGRMIIKERISESVGKVSLENLPSGLYLIQATSTRPKKLLITK